MAATKLKQITQILSNPSLNFILRLFVGGTFLLSAVTKLPDHSTFVEIVKDYDLLPDYLATGYGNVLPWIELVVGVYLLLGILHKYSAFASILMAASFMVANISSVVRGEHQCGSCFGETISLQVWQAMTIDVLIIIAAFILLLSRDKKPLLSLENLILNRKNTDNIDQASASGGKS